MLKKVNSVYVVVKYTFAKYTVSLKRGGNKFNVAIKNITTKGKINIKTEFLKS